MKQIVSHKKIGNLQGILLILGLVLILLALNLLLGVLKPYIGYAAASICFWLLGGLIAFLMMRVYVMAYSYELTPDVLRVCRRYGKRERYLEDVYLNKLVFVGAPEAAAARYPQAKTRRARHGSCPLPLTALVHQTPDGTRILLIQADEELLCRLKARLKR